MAKQDDLILISTKRALCALIRKFYRLEFFFFLDNRRYFNLKKISHMLQNNDFPFLCKNKIEKTDMTIFSIVL